MLDNDTFSVLTTCTFLQQLETPLTALAIGFHPTDCFTNSSHSITGMALMQRKEMNRNVATLNNQTDTGNLELKKNAAIQIILFVLSLHLCISAPSHVCNMSGNNFTSNGFTERGGLIVNDDEPIVIRFCTSAKALYSQSHFKVEQKITS